MIYDPYLVGGYYSIDFVKCLRNDGSIYYNFDSDGDIFFQSYHGKVADDIPKRRFPLARGPPYRPLYKHVFP